MSVFVEVFGVLFVDVNFLFEIWYWDSEGQFICVCGILCCFDEFIEFGLV